MLFIMKIFVKRWLTLLILFFLIFTIIFFTVENNRANTGVVTSSSDISLGNWTDYNGIIFGNAIIHHSTSGGSLAVNGEITVNSNFTIGQTHSSVYDATRHIGEYSNENGYPSFLFAGDNITVDPRVNSLNVLGGAVAMNNDMHSLNTSLNPGFTANASTSSYEIIDQSRLDRWFDDQYNIVKETSRLFAQANDTEIDVSDFSNSAYMNQGASRFKNKYLTIDGEVYENALFITVRTPENIDFGLWWPIYSIIHVDVNWALDHDLIVFNFPDAVNVTLGQSAFAIIGMSHWSTTVDAWIGERGIRERRALAEKVVYNFPYAQNIEATRTLIQGSILAPNANFRGIGEANDGHGHIYGHVIAKDFIAESNFTIHAFSLSPLIFEIAEESVIGSPVEKASLKLWQNLYFNGESTNVPVAGGEFVILNENSLYYDGVGGFVDNLNDAKTYLILENEDIIIEDVPLGKYNLCQIRAPDGFYLNDINPDIEHTYYMYEFTLDVADEVLEMVRYIQLYVRDVAFVKIDADDARGLMGAKFVLIREQDKYSDTLYWGEEYVSDADGNIVINDLPLGTYHLMEIEVPDGYELSENEDFQFTINWEGELKMYIEDDGDLIEPLEYPLIIENKKGISLNNIVIIKYALDESNPDYKGSVLTGAEFDLYLFNDIDSVWEEVTKDALDNEIVIKTNDFGYCRVKNLSNGIYRLVESKSPIGYQITNLYEDDNFPNKFYAYEFTFDGDKYLDSYDNHSLNDDVVISHSDNNSVNNDNFFDEDDFLDEATDISYDDEGDSLDETADISYDNEDDSLDGATDDISYEDDFLDEVTDDISYEDDPLDEAIDDISDEDDPLDEAIDDISDEDDPLDEATDDIFYEDDSLDEATDDISNEDEDNSLDEATDDISNEDEDNSLDEATDISNEDKNNPPDEELYDNTEDKITHTIYIPNKPLTVDVAIRNVSEILDDVVPLAESFFKLEKQMNDGISWKEIEHALHTDTNGEIIFSDLIYGNYRLTQLALPVGYTKIEPNEIYFTLYFDDNDEPFIDAYFDDESIGGYTNPISVRNFCITIKNMPYTSDYIVYKISDRTKEFVDDNGNVYSRLIEYLEGAIFRLQRNVDGEWIDYGSNFSSKFLYNQERPTLDYYGNHLAAAVSKDRLVLGDYRLVELTMPDGFTTASNIEVLLNDSTIGYENCRFSITESMLGVGETVSHTIMNYAPLNVTINHVNMEKMPLAAPTTFSLIPNTYIDINNYIVDLYDYQAIHYMVDNREYALSEQLFFTGEVEVTIYYVSTIIDVRFPSKIEFYAYHTDNGSVTSDNYQIINKSDLPVEIRFLKLVADLENLDSINFVANASDLGDIHLNLNLPDSILNNGFNSMVPNISPNDELNVKLGILGGISDWQNSKVGIFTIGGKYIGPFYRDPKRPKVSFIFSFSPADLEWK